MTPAAQNNLVPAHLTNCRLADQTFFPIGSSARDCRIATSEKLRTLV